jgi:hypothetical protein
MIRRGLQIFLCVVFLGAAPCFSQDYSNFPQSLFLQDRPYTGAVDPNGYYVLVVAQQDYGSSIYQRFGQDPAISFRIGLYYTKPNATWPNGFWEIRLEEGGVVRSQTVVVAATLPTSFAMQGGGTVIPNQLPPADPYEEAFPDWEAAGVKIPLGFGFGLALWASAFAIVVPIRWVRELANAAS